MSAKPCWATSCLNDPKWKVERFPMGTRGYVCTDHLALLCGYIGNEQNPVLVAPASPFD